MLETYDRNLKFKLIPERKSGEGDLELEHLLVITSGEGTTGCPRTKQFPTLGDRRQRHGNSGPMGKRILRWVWWMTDERWTAWTVESTLVGPNERSRMFGPGRIP